MSGTCGPKCTGSCEPQRQSLQSALESRLQARTDLDGSMEYSLTWRRQATPQGRQICVLRASAPHTSDNGFIGWVTPSARDWKDTPGMAQEQGSRKRLDQTPRQAAAALQPPAWMPCLCCEDFICVIHGVHTSDCDCPPIEEWDHNPYGPSLTHSPVQTAGVEYDPAHSRWLMGFPDEWDAFESMETQS